MANEWLVTLITLTIILFTPWINEPTIEFYLGWVTISLTILATLINLYQVIFGVFHQIKLLYKRYKKRFDHYRTFRAQKLIKTQAEKELFEKKAAEKLQRLRIADELEAEKRMRYEQLRQILQ